MCVQVGPREEEVCWAAWDQRVSCKYRQLSGLMRGAGGSVTGGMSQRGGHEVPGERWQQVTMEALGAITRLVCTPCEQHGLPSGAGTCSDLAVKRFPLALVRAKDRAVSGWEAKRTWVGSALV